MIRLYRHMALQLMMTLMYLKDSQIKFENVYTTVIDRWSGRGVEGHSNEAVSLVRDIREDYSFKAQNEDYDVMLDQLVEQLSKETNDVDLIDTIVRILGLPYATSYVSEKTLTSLKKAILLPGELVNLKNSLKEQELHCGNCHKELISGEMVTFSKGGLGGVKDSVNFWCANCLLPTYVACPNCKDKVIDMPVGVTKGLRKRKPCAACEAGANGEVPVVNEVPEPAVMRIRAGANNMIRDLNRVTPRGHDYVQAIAAGPAIGGRLGDVVNIQNIAAPMNYAPIAFRNEPLEAAENVVFRDADEHIANLIWGQNDEP